MWCSCNWCIFCLQLVSVLIVWFLPIVDEEINTGCKEVGCRSLEELIRIVVKYHPDADVEMVRKAYYFAEKAHEGQMRKSGEPYFYHPLTVAGILARLMLDPPTIAAETGLRESQVLFALSVFSELSLLEFTTEPLRYRMLPSGKVSLESSGLRSRLMRMKGGIPV